MKMSWSVLFSAWPKCRAAVTLGGGMTMAYGSPGSAGSAWNSFSSVQTRLACGSTVLLSYALGSSVLMESLARKIANRKLKIANKKRDAKGAGFAGQIPCGGEPGRTLSYDDRHGRAVKH